MQKQIIAGLVLLYCSYVVAQNLEEARRIQATVLGVDAHNDTAQRVLIEKVDIGQRLSDGMIDLPRLQEGGVHVFFPWSFSKGWQSMERD